MGASRKISPGAPLSLNTALARVHYRDEATVCCFSTNLAFFPVLNEVNAVSVKIFKTTVIMLTIFFYF